MARFPIQAWASSSDMEACSISRHFARLTVSRSFSLRRSRSFSCRTWASRSLVSQAIRTAWLKKLGSALFESTNTPEPAVWWTACS